MDAHHERSGSKFMEDSAPDALNKYEGAISKKAKTSNLDSQLRQVRLYLASPKTYICSRFSSEWTDTLLTLIEKSGTDANLDPMVVYSILLKVA
ncbi:hypothetical protein HPULCUR_001905 [Helicostylum pulchrum]|uniref:Uncharacterized protein n=1 Tax=Helicostylum pulchrum TaxID=562976 RepID=A0ABP9XQ39_9FUNG